MSEQQPTEQVAVAVSVQDGLAFQEFRAYMEGFSDGIAAAVQRAITTRLNQLPRQPAASPAEEPAGPVEPNNG